ncbi:MAG: Holliday junction resolvase RuvX [Acidobacteria bacterium]|nr:Holliday junction resolvase RuvX [Acidobacteriota bacterium]
MKSPGRILAIDLGTKNVGLAVSDPLGLTAQPLPTLRRSNRRADLARLREVVEALGVTRVVVGHPLHLKGFAGARAQEAERFADGLRAELDLPVELFDERLTTLEAERHLRASGARPEKRKEAIDQVAAMLILQAYLDREAALHASSESSATEA